MLRSEKNMIHYNITIVFILVYIFSEYKMMDDVKEADEKNLLNIQILPGSYREVEYCNC